MENLQVGSKVHYMQPNGAHSEAVVTFVHNKVTGVVDLRITRNDTIQDTYDARTVAYREKPVAYAWHWPEDEPSEAV